MFLLIYHKQGHPDSRLTSREFELGHAQSGHQHLTPTGSPTLAATRARLIARPLMGSALHMRSSTTLAVDLALFIGVHRSEPPPPAFPFCHHCDHLLFCQRGLIPLVLRAIQSCRAERLVA